MSHLGDRQQGAVGALLGEPVGELSIAVIDNWTTESFYPLADVLRAFGGRTQQVHIHFHTLAPDKIEPAVPENRVNPDSGVFHQHRPGLVYEALYDDPMELYSGVGHALFDLAPHDLDRDDLHTAGLALRAHLSERQVVPLTGELPSTAAARQIEGVAFLILSGRRIGYLPVSYAQRWVESRHMRSIMPETYRLNTKIELVARRGVQLTMASQTFAGILRETARPFRI